MLRNRSGSATPVTQRRGSEALAPFIWPSPDLSAGGGDASSTSSYQEPASSAPRRRSSQWAPQECGSIADMGKVPPSAPVLEGGVSCGKVSSESCVPLRPLLSGWLILYRGGGGWVGGSEAKKKVCVPKIDLQVRAPLITFIFFLRKNFLMWVGGWVGQPKSRGANLTPPPPTVSLSKGLVPLPPAPAPPMPGEGRVSFFLELVHRSRQLPLSFCSLTHFFNFVI